MYQLAEITKKEFCAVEAEKSQEGASIAKVQQMCELIHVSKNLDERFYLILACFTAGEGFGFNRAFLLLVDPDTKQLKGKIAMGPDTPNEAGMIWEQISKLPKRSSLKETFTSYCTTARDEDHHVNKIVKDLIVFLEERNNILVTTMEKGRPFVASIGANIDESTRALLRRLEIDTVGIIPLKVEEKAIGCILVDNAFSRHPILKKDMEIIHLFANQAALAIDNARLQQTLAMQLESLGKAYKTLAENQQQMIESEKMAAMGKMAAIAAHEFRTPLVSIGGFCRLTLKHIDPRSQIAEHMRIVITETARLERVVEMLLEYVGNPNPNKKLSSINHLIEEVAIFMSSKLEQIGIKLELTLSLYIKDIQCDIWQIRQVLLNLFSNAIEAMPKGGLLSVATLPEENGIKIIVKDTGVGIPQDKLNDIFQPFYSTKSSGPGLGLYISKEIISKHNGTIGVSSHPEGGTTFAVFLPC
ncbi:MAG: ATP-binding protein [Pseudomonadota bacterium]